MKTKTDSKKVFGILLILIGAGFMISSAFFSLLDTNWCYGEFGNMPPLAPGTYTIVHNYPDGSILYAYMKFRETPTGAGVCIDRVTGTLQNGWISASCPSNTTKTCEASGPLVIPEQNALEKNPNNPSEVCSVWRCVLKVSEPQPQAPKPNASEPPVSEPAPNITIPGQSLQIKTSAAEPNPPSIIVSGGLNQDDKAMRIVIGLVLLSIGSVLLFKK